MRYFKKEIVSTKLYLSNGAIMHWDEVKDDTGIIATEDGFILKELDSAISRHVGGVVEISAEIYDELKKNSWTITASNPSSLNVGEAMQQLRRLQARIANLSGNAPAAGTNRTNHPDALKQTELPATPQTPEQKFESAPLVVPDLEPVLSKIKRPRGRPPKLPSDPVPVPEIV
jgi:hypothetical protein